MGRRIVWRLVASGKRRALVLCIAAVFALSRPAGAQSNVSPAQARALYDAAYDRWRGLPRAPYVTYDQILSVTRKGRVQVRRSSVALRIRDHACRIIGIPLDSRDRVDAPRLSDRCFSPDSALTFVQRAGESNVGPLPVELATPAPGASGEPRTIGRVSARARAYEVTYIGEETIDGVPTAHLLLRPYGDPAKHLIRDLWIDRATNGVVRLHGEATFSARLASIDFIADYTEDATSQTLRHVAGFAKAQVLFVKAGADFTVDLTNNAYPALLPDALFSKGAATKQP